MNINDHIKTIVYERICTQKMYTVQNIRTHVLLLCVKFLCKSRTVSLRSVKMGKKRDLSEEEKAEIIKKLGKGVDTLQISKLLKRDHRTIQSFVNAGKNKRKDYDKTAAKRRRAKICTKLKIEVSKNPHATSKTIFQNAGLPMTSRNTRCRMLLEVAKVKKMQSRPLLTKRHKENRISWAHQYLKLDFSKVIFTDECRATLDGPDGWTRGWVQNGTNPQERLRRQQGGGGVMFWAAIIGDQLIGPVKVEDGVKINSAGYCTFLEANFLPWYNNQPAAVKESLIFQQDNAPSHASRETKGWLADQGLSAEKIMDWPPNSPDLNPIENLWAVLKQKVYRSGRQYNSKRDLWAAIEEAAASIDANLIKRLTSSMDRRLLEVIKKSGGHVNM